MEIKWIKITTTMFDDEKIRVIQKMPEGSNILLIWIRLLILAGRCNASGYIYLNENIPYTEEMLAIIFDMSITTVRLAIQTFQQFKMIEISENHLIKIVNWDKHQNVDGLDKIRELNRLRQQKRREKQKLLPSPKEESTKEVDKDIDVDVRADNVRNNVTSRMLHNVTCHVTHNIIEHFNNNIHMMTPVELDLIDSYLKDGMSEDSINKAIDEAVLNNKRNMAYIKKILNTWLDAGLKTKKEIEEYQENWKKSKTNKETAATTTTNAFDFTGL